MGVEQSKSSSELPDHLKRLIEAQKNFFPRIETELKKGKKKTCWSWYLFPTEKEGANDPFSVYVKKEEIPLLLSNADIFQWKYLLFLLEKAIREKGIREVLPNRHDQGRCKYFCKFFLSSGIYSHKDFFLAISDLSSALRL